MSDVGDVGRVASGSRGRAAVVGPPSPVRRSKSGESGERVTEAEPAARVRRQDPAASRAIAHE
jgi:hypothetical protein